MEGEKGGMAGEEEGRIQEFLSMMASLGVLMEIPSPLIFHRITYFHFSYTR